MPVHLQVREVRNAIYIESGLKAGAGAPATPALGTLFHNVLGSLFGPDPERNCVNALRMAENSVEAWASTLRQHLYLTQVGPYIARNRASLQAATAELQGLWSATENFSKWIAPLLWKYAQELGWPAAGTELISSEEALSWGLREAGWTDSVRLTGVADLILRIPENGGEWCVVEYKLGRTSPEADLAQACLYHQMLAQQNLGNKPGGSLAVVSFAPEIHQQTFRSKDLDRALSRLKTLIGALAGVSGKRQPAVVPQPETRPQEKEMERLLFKTFEEFGTPVERAGEPIVGPAFIRYFVSPARGIKTKAVLSRGDDIQGRLKLAASPILAMQGGRVTVDVQRSDRQVIPFAAIRDQLESGHARRGSSRLPVGVNLEGKLVIADLAETKHVHLLVVGTTGSGKSEWLRTALAGLLLANTPDTLRLVLIDPKRNAFNDLKGSPFLQEGQVLYPDEYPVANAFEWLIEEMEARYALIEQAGVDDLRALVEKGQSKPRIVCVCDEYADLLRMGNKREREGLERQIMRLGSKARAAGIHLILATQEASRQTIRGPIDATLPARVVLRTVKEIESRLVLGENGAEKLLGYGDLLFKDLGPPVRLQAPYLSKEEREAIFALSRA